MEKHQIQPQNVKNTKFKLPGLWDKSWVRPYESIWSILNTYKAVNVISDYRTLMKVIGIDPNARVTHDYFISYGIFCNVSNKINDIDNILSNFIPEWYKPQLEEITNKKDISDFFSDKISYCPECIKNGYHSIFHQLKGISKCPLHKNVFLKPYLKQRYVLGSQSAYKGDFNSRTRLRAFSSKNVMIIKGIDFEDISQIPLPSDQKDIPEIATFCTEYGFRKDFDYIKAIGADIFDKNMIPNIGSFLLDFTIEPEVIIKNIKEADALIIEKMNNRISRNDLTCPKLSNNPPVRLFRYVHLQIFIMEKLKSYTYDEIDYKCYQIERGRFISYDDELGITLLYLLFITGDERIEESLSIIREANDISEKYQSGYQYYPSEICIHDLNISVFCISAQYYILEDYMNTNFEKFVNHVKLLGGMEKPLMRNDLILYPVHMIYIEKDNVIKIYRY